ncbi:hypothetical protein Sros01_03160 [Streptomyces roseochromogenus]|nr:hypothetical protein Sros01_03160 [Streptomyces roseochromogenus]
MPRQCEFIHDAYPLPRRHPGLAPTAPERPARRGGAAGFIAVLLRRPAQSSCSWGRVLRRCRGKRCARTWSALANEPEQTVEALAAKAAIKARPKEKTADMKQHSAEKASLIADQIREKAEQAARLVRDNTPDSVLDNAAQAVTQVWDGATRAGQYAADKTPDPLLEKAGQAATAARGNRTPLLVAGAVIIALVLVRRSRARRR